MSPVAPTLKQAKLNFSAASSSSSNPPPNPIRHVFDLEAYLLQLLERLYKDRPEHSIFGQPEKGLVRLPAYQSRRANQPCWASVLKTAARHVQHEMGDRLELKSCWLVRGDGKRKYNITVQKDKHNSVLRSVLLVRLIHFFEHPSEANFRDLQLQEVGHQSRPFSHWCGNGEIGRGPDARYCLNGAHHGRFATKGENESHKQCTYGARPLCPGHGDGSNRKAFCMFMHADGTPQPCRNLSSHVPACNCNPRCYVPQNSNP